MEAPNKTICEARAKDYLFNQKKREKWYPLFLLPDEDDSVVRYISFSDEEVVRLQQFLNESGYDSHSINTWYLRKQIGKCSELDRVLNDPFIDYNCFAPILDLDHYFHRYILTCVKYNIDEQRFISIPFLFPFTDDEYTYLLVELQMNHSFTYNDLLLCNPQLGEKLTKMINDTYEEESLEVHYPFVILFDEAIEDVKTIMNK